MRDYAFIIVMVLLWPIIVVGMLIGLVWAGLVTGFKIIDIKLMGYILDE